MPSKPISRPPIPENIETTLIFFEWDLVFFSSIFKINKIDAGNIENQNFTGHAAKTESGTPTRTNIKFTPSTFFKVSNPS